LIFTCAIFFIHKMITEPQRVDFALWNDFRIKPSVGKSRVFEDSRLIYSNSQGRFLQADFTSDRVEVSYSSPIDLFEPSVAASITLYTLFKVSNVKSFKIKKSALGEYFTFNCGEDSYELWIRKPVLDERTAQLGEKFMDYKDGCVDIRYNAKFEIGITRGTRRQLSSLLKLNEETLGVMRRKYKIHKFVSGKELRGFLFVAGIDSHRIVFFNISRKDGVVRKMGSFDIENSFPQGNLLRCGMRENCLNLRVVYNKKDEVFFIFMPPLNLILFQPKNFVLTSKFQGLGAQKMANMGVFADKGLLMSRVHRTNFEKEPMIEVNIYHYNLKTKKYRTYHEDLSFVEPFNSFLSISKLMTFEKKGLFRRRQSRKVFADHIVSNENGDRLLCLFLKSKRVLCYKLFWNVGVKKEDEVQPLELFFRSCLKSLGAIVVLIFSMKLCFVARLWK
jgi:hypothetical protein